MSKNRRFNSQPPNSPESEVAPKPLPMKADPIDSCVGCGSPVYIRITGDLDEVILRRFARGEGRVLRHISSEYAVISFPNFFTHSEAIGAFESFIQGLDSSPESSLVRAPAPLLPDDLEPSAPLGIQEGSGLSQQAGELAPESPSELS